MKTPLYVRIKFLCFFILALHIYLSGQTTNISGIINSYAGVLSITNQNCSSRVDVDNPGAFHAGDTILIMQMKGAVIDTTNTTSFGDILNLNGAGHYEYGIVNHVTGATIYLNAALATAFNIAGRVQMVRIPNYVNANITGTLIAKKWDGTSGGVLAFFASGSVTLNADINVSGLGFRGGDVSNNPDGSCGSGSPDFYYPLVQPGMAGYWNFGGAKKGEGITELIDDKMAGRGKLANGGGGGNKHNHGGGGGSNYTRGGIGGESLGGCPVNGYMGIGGVSLASHISAGTMFPGGGGGSGDFNNGVGSYGADGGGIVIIKANSINGNNHRMTAKGNDELVVGGAALDGVGGGGGGGSIYLDISIVASGVTLDVSGGHGGDQGHSCVGTGGGGGIGAVLLTTTSIPSNVSISAHPGRSGVFTTNGGGACQMGAQYYATGGDSTIGIVQTSVSPISFVNNSALSVYLGADTGMCAGGNIILDPHLGVAQYVWQDGSTGSTYTVTAPGTYWLTVTLGGCTGSDTIIVSSVPGPAVHLGNDTAICSGNTIVLDPHMGAAQYLWQNASTGSTYTVTTPGTYWVRVTQNGCSGSDTVVVGSVSVLPVHLGNDTAICSGSSIVLDPHVGNAQYVWQDASTGSTYTGTAAGTYWVTVTQNGCSGSDTIIVGTKPLPSVYLGNDTLICSGSTVVLDPNLGSAQYLWQNASTGRTYTVTAAGTYSVTVTQNGCSGSDTINIYETLSPSVHLGNDTLICRGQTVVLDPHLGAGQYVWTDGSTASVYTATTPGTYWVTVTQNGCAGSDTIVVGLAPPLPLYLGNDTGICTGETLVLKPVPDVSSYSYVWQDGSTHDYLAVTQTGQYTLAVSHLGCTGADTIAVVVSPAPHADLGADTTLCEGKQLVLDVANPGADYLWNDGSDTFQRTITSAGIYSVTVDLNGCKRFDSVSVSYTELPKGHLSADMGICIGEEILLYDSCTGCTYLWQDGSMQWSITASQTGIYSLAITNGCGSVNETISVHEDTCHCEVVAPNAFTPNGDGINDYFLVSNSCAVSYFSVKVFDRWGEKVYDSYDAGAGWDGMYKGHLMSAGVYVYLIDETTFVHKHFEDKHLRGSLVLIR
ncbi:MAG: hypothetical protein JWO03_3596 [Bacteroidetes bacterium]|nr:hypothetical protein [Bacteroidota bacterium]